MGNLIMYLFIILSLAISYLVHVDHAWLLFLLSPVSLYIGLAGVILASIMALLKKLPCHIWYDLFASSTLLIWYCYWYPYFRDGSPVFYYFPLYFALISALFSMLFIKQREQIDEDTLVFLQWLSDSGRFNPAVIVVFVWVSLFLKQHFLLYPVAMTLFLTRYTLAASLEKKAEK